MLASDMAGSSSSVCAVRGRRGVLDLAGVPARLLAALGMGVPFDLRGRPLRLGVIGASPRTSASSVVSRRGTVVVVTAGVLRRRVAERGVGDWNSLRRGPMALLLPGATTADASAPSSVSTVTSRRWGDLLSPTCSSNICLRGELLRARKRWERWLRVTRRVAADEGGAKKSPPGRVWSLRGSGDDMMSALGVAGSTTLCQRRLKDSGWEPEYRGRGIGDGGGGGA